jgi:hypothetical protein
VEVGLGAHILCKRSPRPDGIVTVDDNCVVLAEYKPQPNREDVVDHQDFVSSLSM